MSCIGEAFCPSCREIIYGNGCMCGLTCDRGEPRHKCTMDAPDGTWPRRMYGQPKPDGTVETRNGWRVGWTLNGEWKRSEPFHPTKSPSELRWEWLTDQAVGLNWPTRNVTRLLADVDAVEAGGGI